MIVRLYVFLSVSPWWSSTNVNCHCVSVGGTWVLISCFWLCELESPCSRDSPLESKRASVLSSTEQPLQVLLGGSYCWALKGSLVQCMTLGEGCLRPTAWLGEVRRASSRKSYADGKVRKFLSCRLVRQDIRDVHVGRGIHGCALLTGNGRKLMLMCYSYTPCSLLEK